MNEHDVTLLMQKVAVAAEQLNRSCERAQQDLRQCVQHVPALVRQSLEEQLRDISDNITAGVNRGLAQSLAACDDQLREAGNGALNATRSTSGNHGLSLREAGNGALNATQVLADQFRNVESLHRRLIWKVSGVALGALALVLGGAIWLSMYYAGVIRDNQISADLLKAYNGADVTLCGGRLCAKIGKKYMPVELR